jgi:DNA-binding response OmpR family regulator
VTRSGAAPTRVAVVEDDGAIGRLLKDVLSLEGFDVVLFSDGRTAFECVRRSGCRAVVLDKRLPGCDGIEIVQQLRRDAVTDDLPVVMLTAQTDNQSTWEAWKAGVNYFMKKPFNPSDLVRALRKVLD